MTYHPDGTFTGTPGPDHGGYHDIDACPSLDFLIHHRDHPQYARFLQLAVAKRPEEELFAIQDDPDCVHNLADDPQHAEAKDRLRQQLQAHLQATGDPRVTGHGDVWETYPRVSKLRWFEIPEWAEENPGDVPLQEWLEKRRPMSEQ